MKQTLLVVFSFSDFTVNLASIELLRELEKNKFIKLHLECIFESIVFCL